jgi:hypothetical protein
MWRKRMAAFLRVKGQILWDVTVDTTYVHPANFLAPRSRDMFDANNKAVDYLYRGLCPSKFDWVQTEDLVCRIWLELKNAHAGIADVQACCMRLAGESTRISLISPVSHALFERFTVVVNNMTANVDVLPFDDHDRAVKLLHALDRTVWEERLRPFLSPRSTPL